MMDSQTVRQMMDSQTVRQATEKEWNELGEEFSRCVTVLVPARDLLKWLHMQKELPDYVAMPDHRLPDGFKVMGCCISAWGRSLRFLVWHPTFDKVPEGEEPPLWPETTCWRTFRLEKREEQPIIVTTGESREGNKA